MCFPAVGASLAIINTEKELYAFSHARFSFSLPYFRFDCFISLSFIFPSFSFPLLGSPLPSRINLCTDVELEQLQYHRL